MEQAPSCSVNSECSLAALMAFCGHLDVFSTDTFSTNKEVDIFSTSNKMGHIFDH